MEKGQMKSYWSLEVSKLLDISTSTLRKWSIALEERGYIFFRDENDKRAYLERDIIALLKLSELLSNKIGMDNAVKTVVFNFSEKNSDSRVTLVQQYDERLPSRYVEFKAQLQKIQEENQNIYDYLQRIDRSLQVQQERVTVAEQSTEKKLDILLSRINTYGMRKRWWNFWR